VAFETLGDRVPTWATLNEPWVVADAGYLHGVHAPGHRDLAEAARVAHHLLCAHGAAVQAYRATATGQIGLVVNLEPKDAASDSEEDRAAASRAEAYMNRQYLDAVLLGRYPDEMPALFGRAWRDPPATEMALIRQPIDFLGVNYYTRGLTRHDPQARPFATRTVRNPGGLYTDTGWEMHPPSFVRALRDVRDRYGPVPLYVTENGAALHDPPRAPAAGIEDPLRIHYLVAHLRALRQGMAAGLDVRGYFAWSLLDNFEWSLGYSTRFGLVHVDFDTLRRTPKASARLYRDVIRSNGRVLGRLPG
jgi:beta-glucosidase